MAAPSSVLAWEMPWTEEPGRLQSWHHKELDMTEHLTQHNQKEPTPRSLGNCTSNIRMPTNPESLSFKFGDDFKTH